MTSLHCVGCAVGDTSGGRADLIYFVTCVGRLSDQQDPTGGHELLQ